jgi:hypothetical protein
MKYVSLGYFRPLQTRLHRRKIKRINVAEPHQFDVLRIRGGKMMRLRLQTLFFFVYTSIIKINLRCSSGSSKRNDAAPAPAREMM